jgi:hypothetical protein
MFPAAEAPVKGETSISMLHETIAHGVQLMQRFVRRNSLHPSWKLSCAFVHLVVVFMRGWEWRDAHDLSDSRSRRVVNTVIVIH